MGFNFGLAALAGNSMQDQIIARRKDAVLQEEEADARARREEFASRRGLRDNEAALRDEETTQKRKDLSKAAANQAAIQETIKKAMAEFESKNPAAAESTQAATATAAAPTTQTPQAAAGITPATAASSEGQATPIAASGIAAQTAASDKAAPAKFSDFRSLERAAYTAQAVADKHLEIGDLAGYKQATTDAIHMRDALRAQRFNQADALYAQTKDPTVYAKLVYPLINDGYTLVDAKQGVGKDGAAIVTMSRRNDKTGEVETKTVPVEQYLAGVKELRQPGILAKLEEKIAEEKRDVKSHIEKQAPALKNAMDIAKMNDATHRISANAQAANAYASAGLHRAQTDALKSAAGSPVWNDKADEFLKSRYTVKDESGAVSVDGSGMQFAKQIAIAQARRNGGDTTTALGYAFDVDTQLKERVAAAIKADPKADPRALLRAERAKFLQILTTPQQTQQQTNAAAAGLPITSQPAAVTKATATQPAATQVEDMPLSQRIAQAIAADSKAGTSRNFNALADEVEKAAPNMQNQLATLKSALTKAAAGQKASIERRIAEIETDIPLMESILAQRKAKRGY